MVYKYKYIKRELALEIFKRLGVAPGTPADKVRVIRVRMTLRGFKDRDAWMLETFAGTSSRLSKRIVVSEAVVQEFELWAFDVRKAFLKGVTYEELADMTGDEVRDVYFDLPDWCVPILRQF